MAERAVAMALQQPWVSVCNDSQGTSSDGLLGKEHPHVRAYGAFPHILAKYVREEKKLTLEDAIRKFTSLPAGRMRFTGRGVLKAGLWEVVKCLPLDSMRHRLP
jgi:N-acyl-D-amino-acid deacylase